MKSSTVPLKAGARIVSHVRHVNAGGTRIASAARVGPVAAVAPNALLARFLRTSSASRSTQTEVRQPVDQHTTRSAVGPLGSDLKPADMLTFLNSNDFSSYRSISGNQNALLGDNESLAVTALTHESWMYGLQGHNRRLAFLGRRALKTYLSLYLFHLLSEAGRAETLPDAEVRYLQNIMSAPHGVDDLIRTQALGDHVGRALKLEQVMRWHPTMVRLFLLANVAYGPYERYERDRIVQGARCLRRGSPWRDLSLSGTWSYSSQGAQVAQQFFLSRILPNIEQLSRDAPSSIQESITKSSKEATEALHHSP